MLPPKLKIKKGMNKTNYLTFSGVSMALAGMVMLTSESIGVAYAKILVPALFFTGGVSAYLFSAANPQHAIAKQYHLLQGAGMAIFAIIIAAGPENLGEFLMYVSYFMGVFGLIELLFAFMVLNRGDKLNKGILMSRFIAGASNLVGSVLILATSLTDELSGLIIAGILILLGGVAFILFSFRIRRMEITGAPVS
ncbi:MAG: hypothetical protein AAF960_10725 [Bacteroidota bacterium]